MQQNFNELIKHTIKPFLAEHGFKKKGLNFTRWTEKLIYIIQFQKSSGNSVDHVMFYVNCSIYTIDLAQIQGKEALTDPQEVDCHFRARIGELTRSAPDRYEITSDSNMEQLRDDLLLHLNEVIQYFQTITSARDIVDYYTAGPYLHLGEESFQWLLQTRDVAAARQYLQALREKHGEENRWAIFERKYRAIFNQYGIAFDRE